MLDGLGEHLHRSISAQKLKDALQKPNPDSTDPLEDRKGRRLNKNKAMDMKKYETRNVKIEAV